MAEELLGGSLIPDTGLKFCLVGELDFLRTRFPTVRIDSILNFIDDRYVGNGRPFSTVPTFALLVLKTVKYSISFGHLLELVAYLGVAEE